MTDDSSNQQKQLMATPLNGGVYIASRLEDVRADLAVQLTTDCSKSNDDDNKYRDHHRHELRSIFHRDAKWIELPDLPEPRAGSCGIIVGEDASVPAGKREILVFGGLTASRATADDDDDDNITSSSTQNCDSVVLYKEESNSWETCPYRMNLSRGKGCEVVKVGSRLYVFGGSKILDDRWKTMEILDLSVPSSSRSFTLVPIDHHDTTNTERRREFRVVAIGHQIYLIGGKSSSGHASTDVDIFDTIWGSWCRGPSLPESYRRHYRFSKATRLGSSSIVLISGNQDEWITFRLDCWPSSSSSLEHDHWTQLGGGVTPHRTVGRDVDDIQTFFIPVANNKLVLYFSVPINHNRLLVFDDGNNNNNNNKKTNEWIDMGSVAFLLRSRKFWLETLVVVTSLDGDGINDVGEGTPEELFTMGGIVSFDSKDSLVATCCCSSKVRLLMSPRRVFEHQLKQIEALSLLRSDEGWVGNSKNLGAGSSAAPLGLLPVLLHRLDQERLISHVYYFVREKSDQIGIHYYY